MSCSRAEKLMPLYAAGDLPAGREGRAVAAHVAVCRSCAALADEYRASREWAREAGDVPEFGEEFYESLRANVLDRVNRDTRPAAPARAASLFPALLARPRLAYAASVALAACALAFYFGRDTNRPPHDGIADTRPTVNSVNPPQPAHAEATPDATPQPSPNEAQQPSPDERQTAQPKRAAGNFKRTPTLRRAAPPRDTPARELTASANDAARRGASPASDDARQGVAQPALREGPISVARIEIQTADPNIRIIWLAPSAADEPGATGTDRIDPER